MRRIPIKEADSETLSCGTVYYDAHCDFFFFLSATLSGGTFFFFNWIKV